VLVELGRALVQDPLLLLLDETGFRLDTRETAAFATILLEVRARRTTAMLLVEHDLDLVRRRRREDLRARLRKLIASGRVDEVLAEPVVRRAYLGDVT